MPCVHHRFHTLRHLEVVDTARCVKPVTFMSNMLCLGPEKKANMEQKTHQSMGMLDKYSGCWSRCCFLVFFYFHPMQTGKKHKTCIGALQMWNISVVNSMSASTSLKIQPTRYACSILYKTKLLGLWGWCIFFKKRPPWTHGCFFWNFVFFFLHRLFHRHFFLEDPKHWIDLIALTGSTSLTTVKVIAIVTTWCCQSCK